jgi:hypothetical protein
MIRSPHRCTICRALFHVTAAVLLCLPAHAAMAQDSSGSVNPSGGLDTAQLRRDCERAQQVLERRPYAPDMVGALSQIPLCGSTTAPTLIDVWNHPPADRHELLILVTATRDIITRNLLQTLLAAFQRTDLTTEQRAASLMVLVTYADRTSMPAMWHFVGIRDILLIKRYNGGYYDPEYDMGRGRLSVSVRSLLVPVLRRVAVFDPNLEMQTAAELALQNMGIW